MKNAFYALAALAVLSAGANGADCLWVEAEDFREIGAWRVDTQFTHKMGSAYLIAPGVLKPIGAAKTEIEIGSAGEWTVWARTKDWVPEHHPGRFALSVDGRRAKGALGATGRRGWVWENAGVFTLAAGKHSLALEDLSGAYARCDAILLTKDAAMRPPDDGAATEKLRARLAPPPEDAIGPFDVVVVGGGPAGLCAAVAAARNGARTALVQDRPVLGGNCSDEIGVRTDGGSCHVANGRESGIVEEWNLLDPNRRGRWISAAAERLASGEKNLSVLLNERVVGAFTNADGRIAAVLARNTRTAAKTRIAGEVFVDATGDGWVGYYAGAKYRFGREAGAEFGEPKSHAPEKADELTMSGCLCYYKYEMRERPIDFAAPAWADVLPEGFDRRINNLKMPWWLEHPNDLDDLAEPEEARDELIRYNFAYWGWLKNRSKLAAEARNAELVSVPIVNGRRESRRLVGDYLLNANDLAAGRVFPDAVCHGGWGMDVHDVLGMKRPVGDGWEKHPIAVPLYSIPFRSLYSVNVPNLLMAGRCLSATHLAFGSARVGGTCAAMGQAAGTAAALCCRHAVSPRELGATRIRELQQQLLRDDQYVPGVRNEDPNDFARGAKATASSEKSEQSFRRPIWGGGPKGAKAGPNGTLLAVGASAAAVVDGVTRIVGTTAHAWVSSKPLPQWISLEFAAPKRVSEIRLTFDTDLSLPYPGYFPETLAKDYLLEVRTGGEWKPVAAVSDNTLRLRVHRFSSVSADAIRLTVKATYGSKEARVYEIRAYGDDSTFRNPSAEFSPSFFWMLNAPLDEKTLNGQLDEMASVGIRAVCPHPFPRNFRPGQCASEMSPEYLSEGYLSAYAKMVDHARDLGFHVWLYDEGGWPSGAACGEVAATDPEGRFCGRYLRLGAGGVPEVVVQPYAVGGGLSGKLPSSLEPGATERFLEVTHGRYFAAFGEDFGRTVKFAFTDEPTRPGAARGSRIAWASDFDREFLARKGYEIRPFAAYLIAGTNTASEAETQARVDYEDVLSQLFVERYLEPIRVWCRRHGIKSGGHLNGEDVPENSVGYGHGSLLRSLRRMDVPGVDTIWRQLFPDYPGRPGRQVPFPRYASSAAHRNGGRHVLSESFAIYGDSLTPDQMKWTVDYQLVRGVTQFVFGYYAVSNAGQWMALFEPHNGPVQPYWRFERPFFTYVHRMSALLARGEPTTEIVVLFDTRDFWAGGSDRSAAAKAHYAVAKELDRRNCEYDFTDDDEIAAATVEDGRLRIGRMSYSTVVLPYSKWMTAAAREKLAAFSRAGGRVIGPSDLATIKPTASLAGAGAADIRVMKRRDGDETIWFFANESVEPRTVRIAFPVEKGAALFRADAETGDFVPLAADSDGSLAWDFPSCGSLAIIQSQEGQCNLKPQTLNLKPETSNLKPETSNPKPQTAWTARPLWCIRAGKKDFEREDLSGEPLREVRLGDWRSWLGNDFSGVVRYRTAFKADRAGRVQVDLGRVAGASRLYVNGREAGTRFFGPHVYEFESVAGEVVLEVDVAGSLANAIFSDEVRDRIARDFPPRSRYDVSQRPFDREFNEGGLFGPVLIR